MRRFYILFAFLFIGTFSYAQTEICNNGLDDDFDGFIDCYDGSCASDPLCEGIFLGNDASCEAVPPAFPQFTMTLDFSSPNETTNHLSRMAIGDLDRDGIPEIVSMNRYTRKLFVLNGNNGSIKHQATVNWEPYWEVAIANLDNDNCGEIFFIGYQNLPGTSNDGVYILAYDCQLNFLWATPQKLRGDPINFGIADFDGDGKEEIYAKDEIYDAKTGIRLIKSTGPTYNRINGGPVAADVVGDDEQELILGLNIYQVNLGPRTADAGSLTLLQSRPEYFVRFEYNATSIADYNLDGFLDVIASGSTIANGTNTTVFFWDVKNNTLKTYSDPQPALGANYTNGWINGTGRLNIADLDGNGQMNASFVSGRFLYALDENFNLLWRVNINEETSGHTGCTLFDFNGDGKAEIVYRDERYIYIIQGTDGSVYSQQACISRTNREYPIVADVDADGSTELCVACGYKDINAGANFNNLDSSRYSHIRVFKSAAEPWVPARRVWNQHGYFVVNVNDDLTIPTKLQQHQLVFSTGNCTQGPNRPLNKFLNQSPYLNSKGCPTYAAPDIAFQVAPTIKPPTCPDLNFKVSFKLTNKGDVALTGNIPVSFYSSDPLQAGATKLSTVNIPVNNLSNGDIVSVDDLIVTGIGSQYVYIVLNDAGTTLPTPITLPNTSFIECDYDNIRFAEVNPLPVTIQAVQVTPNDNCNGPDKGVVRAFIPVAGGENTANYDFYWSNGTTAKPMASADHVGTIYSGLAAGTYTVYARHKTANCNSDTTQVVVTVEPGNFPPIQVNVLSNQTTCSPFNGKLEVVIQGNSGGYKIAWFGESLENLNISAPIASNLKAGSYVAVISKGTCSVSIPATVNPPTVPDAQAQVSQNVETCSNPNSGSVTASALVSGVPQNPSNFTFTWYKYDNTNNTQGSVLDPVHGAGPSRSGLPVGFYQVEVKDNASQCPSTIKPIVEITSAFTFPDTPDIQILSSQTSCDPLHPNGIMTANVSVGGVPQDPANFTFKWFKGQTTQTADLVTTVSDVNGKTINQVAAGGLIYTVQVTNAANCSATAEKAIRETLVIPVVTLVQLTPNTVCDPLQTQPLKGNNGSLKASVTFNGSAISLPDNNYIFEWRDPSNTVITVTDNTNPVLSGLQDGNAYSVTVTRADRFCVSAPDTEPVLPAKVLPVLDTDSEGSNTCLASATPDGSVTVNVTNPLAGQTFRFQWYTGNSATPGNELSTSQTVENLGGPVGSPHPFTVVVTNNNTGCRSSATEFVVDKSVIPVISFSNVTPNTKCSAPFDGSLTAQIDNQIGSITDYIFTWDNGASISAPAINTGNGLTTLSTLEHGQYAVQVTNPTTGCTSTTISNQVPDGRTFPGITFQPKGSRTCDAGKIPDGELKALVSGGANFTYAWTAIGAAPAPSNGLSNQTILNVGGPTFGAPSHAYHVVVKNIDNGCESSNTGQVPDLSVKPTLTLVATPNGVCDPSLTIPSADYSGSITVSAVNHPALTGNITYRWFNTTAGGAPFTLIPLETGKVLGGRDNGKYGVQVTIDDLGCQSEIEVKEVLDMKVLPDINANATPDKNCVGDNGSAQVSTVDGNTLPGNYTFAWYNGAVVSGSAISSSHVLGSSLAGNQTFTVEVINRSNGCVGTETLTVTDGRITPTATINFVKHNTICDLINLTPDGALGAVASDAGSNFTFLWTPAVTLVGTDNQSNTALAPGDYSVVVKNDDTGCISQPDTKTILNDRTYPDPNLLASPQTSCIGTNGKVTADDPGGRTFAWYSGIGTTAPAISILPDAGETNIIDDLAAGDYTVEVTITSTGCKATESVPVATLIVPPTLALNNTQAVTMCGPSPSTFTPNGAASVTLGSITADPLTGPNFEIFYVRTPVINGVGAGSFPTDPAIVKGSAESYTGGANPSPLTNLAPGYLTALVVDYLSGCESTVQTVAIADNTADYLIDIIGTATAGLCSPTAPGGAINVDVRKNGVACTTCTYEWYNGTPSNSNINFFNNPPNVTGSPIAVVEDLGVSVPAGGVSAGNYTLIVRDGTNGCGAFAVENIPTANPALIDINLSQPTLCVNPLNATNNGAIEVVVDKFLPNTDGYTVKIFAGNGPIGAPLVNVTNTNPAVNSFTVPLNNQNSGDYFVQVIDLLPANTACPQGYAVTLLSQAFNPSVTTVVSGNTTCDQLNFSDGSVALTVTKDPSDLSADQNYAIAQITPQPRVAVAANTIVGSGNSGASITLNSFRPQNVQPDYVIRVQDLISFCFTDVTVVVPDAQDLPSSLIVTANPETNCSDATLLNSNGSALADLTDAADADNLFNFTWDNDGDLSSPVFGPQPGLVVGDHGELINQSKVPVANWTMGAVGQGSGDRKFFVQAEKISGTGRACKTAIVQVVIPDEHKDPTLTLTTAFDTFCNATASGGQIGDGKITVVADANPAVSGQQIPGSGGFNYSWTPVPTGSTTPPVASAVPSFIIDELGDGNYTVTVTNLENACVVTNAVSVAAAPYIIEIANKNVIDQRICTNDGGITLTNVNIIDQSNNAVVQSDANGAIDPLYSFQWYNTAAMTAGAELKDGSATNISGRFLQFNAAVNSTVEPGEYPAMQAGTYYVKGRRSLTASIARDCPTQPFTVVVNDVHANPVVDITTLSNTSCLLGTGDGQISINVSDATSAAFGSFTYNYNWTSGNGLVGTNSVGNNGNGIATDGDEDVEMNLLDGPLSSYAVTVLNPTSGCSTNATATISKNASAIFIQQIVATPEVKCDPVLGDGSLTVSSITVSNRGGATQTANVSEFVFDWSRLGNGFVQQDDGSVLDKTTYQNAGGFGVPIGAGTYTVVAKRISGPAGALGMECESAPFEAVIPDKRLSPVVSLTPLANTACDPLFAEGSIEVRVEDQTLVPGPHTYSYTWDAANPTAILPSSGNNGNGSSSDGDKDKPGSLFHNPTPTGTYKVIVTNEQSGCQSAGSTTIFNNSSPIIIPSAIATPQVLCYNDGAIEVQSVEVLGTGPAPLSQFNFDWSRVTLPNVVATTSGAVVNGTKLTVASYPAIGTDQYFVVAERVAGQGGRGCTSAPYHVVIPDGRLYPELTFVTQAPNSSCNPATANGVILATARELNGQSSNAYDFIWTYNSSPKTDIEPSNNTSILSNALDGNYLVTATNTDTGCPITTPFNLVIDRTISTPNVIDVATVDPHDCKPSGSAMVTAVKVGTTGAILNQPGQLDDFNYQWYQGNVAAGNQLPLGGPFTTTGSISNIPTGVYFVVVVDPTTSCPSAGREVIIKPDDIIYPDLNVRQTALQISCNPGVGSAALSVTADGQTDQTSTNYTFTWFANGTNSLPVIGTSATLSNIPAGTYSVTVYDKTTECSISDNYIVEDNTTLFTPVISMASQPRTLCVGTDGEIFARVLNQSPLYPYPYNATTFKADLYFGAAPNLNAAPDMPAIPNTIGFIGNFSQDNLNAGFYTVRIIDTNTGCSAVATAEIKDLRVPPLVSVEEIAAVTNCDPKRPNGVAQAMADGTISGYTFDWYEGSVAAGSPIYSGAQFAELKVKPQQYTVRATNTLTGCFTDINTDIEDATVAIPAATIEVLSHVTSCVINNGALMAYVGPDKNTSAYIFNWYDGTVENPPADNVGETYTGLAVGQYSVTATSIVTGCKSPLTTGEILDEQEFPDFDFVIQNTTCDKNDGFATLVMITNVPVESIEWSNGQGPFLTGPNFTDAAAGFYEVTATTFFGCKTTKPLEIKPDIRPYNGISRNNDGKNDFFQIDCIQNFPTNHVKIFNRAGTLVYEVEGYDNTSTFFDGRSNKGISPMGVNLPDGTYFYIVDKRDGTKPVAGYLEIVK